MDVSLYGLAIYIKYIGCNNNFAYGDGEQRWRANHVKLIEKRKSHSKLIRYYGNGEQRWRANHVKLIEKKKTHSKFIR
jgi:predicted secreted protein